LEGGVGGQIAHKIFGKGAIIDNLSNDWVVFVKPDPEYAFLLAGDAKKKGKGEGNFGGHAGNLENEIEQWLVPVGWRGGPA
jgi:hypothetical protein